MADKLKKQSKTPRPEDQDDDDNTAGGYPKDGEAYVDPNDDAGDDDNEEDDNDNPDDTGGSDDDDDNEPDPRDERIDELQREIDAIKAARTQESAPPKKEEKTQEEIDWEQELFTDPNAAVQKLKKQIREEVTNDYQKDQGQRQFWNQFYQDNPDLKEDDDLVKATLQKNMADLATKPVPEASKKLADLTRDRIMRYSGKKPPKGKKAKVEGADQPQDKKKEPEKPKVTTLSDLIRARKNRRATKASTA